MELPGLVVNHPASHRDRVLQDFPGNAELLERMDSPRRKREIDRSAADEIAGARICSPFVKLDLVAAPAKAGGEQPARQPAADENKLCGHQNEMDRINRILSIVLNLIRLNPVNPVQMKKLHFLASLISFCLVVSSSLAQEPKPDAKPKQFIYVLRLVPRLHSDAAWTKEDEMAIARHLTRFKQAIDKGELILAGRTKEPGNKTFGIAIFEAADET